MKISCARGACKRETQSNWLCGTFKHCVLQLFLAIHDKSHVVMGTCSNRSDIIDVRWQKSTCSSLRLFCFSLFTFFFIVKVNTISLYTGCVHIPFLLLLKLENWIKIWRKTKHCLQIIIYDNTLYHSSLLLVINTWKLQIFKNQIFALKMNERGGLISWFQ